MGDVPAPDLYQGDLDRAQLEALFADLAACAQLQHIRVRGGDAKPDAPTLEGTRDQLLAGTINAAQLLYAFDGEGWCDTVMAVEGGYRLVRVRQQPATGG